jgi:formylglycine-generating enzyme required for sulfatase activity
MIIKGIPLNDLGIVISETLVTQEQFTSVLGYNPSEYVHPTNPVENVTWYDAITFCNVLSVKKNLTPCYDITHARYDGNRLRQGSVFTKSNNNGYRLPTAMQWVYCIGSPLWSGTENPEELHEYAHYNSTNTVPVKSLKPNKFGLYDMTGNVWEWTDNQYVYGGSYKEKDPYKMTLNETDHPYPTAFYPYLGFRFIRNL